MMRSHLILGIESFAIGLVALFLLSGCGLIKGMQDPPDDDSSQNDNGDDVNDCGGDEELTYDGEPADEGDRCGPCNRDRLECDDGDPDANTLVCYPGDLACEGPENLAATDDRQQEVELTWDHVEGATEYYVYRADDGQQLDTVAVEGQEPGETIAYIDDDPVAATPEPPQDFEATDGDYSDRIELSWIFDADEHLPPGENDYEVVAYHDGVDEPESPPESVTGYTTGDFDFDFQLCVVDGECADEDWMSVSFSSSADGEFDHEHDVDDDDRSPNLPEITADLQVGSAQLDYDVPIEISDLEAAAVETNYELRAVTTVGQSGQSRHTTGHVGVDEFHAQLRRGDDEQSLETVDDYDGDLSAQWDEEVYLPATDAIEWVETPPFGTTQHYEVRLWSDDYGADADVQNKVALSDDGFSRKPGMYTASRDKSARRVLPQGQEEASYTALAQPFSDIVVDDQGYAYVGGRVTTSSGQALIQKLDFSADAGGEPQWSDTYVDEGEYIVDVDVASNGLVAAVTRPATSFQTERSAVYLWNEDGERLNRWNEVDNVRYWSLAFNADGDSLFLATEDDDGLLYKLSIAPDYEINKQWSLGEGFYDAFAVALDGEGNVYWGTSNRYFFRLDTDAFEDGAPSVDDKHAFDTWGDGSREVWDMAIGADGYVYASVVEFTGDSQQPGSIQEDEYESWLYRVDVIDHQANALVSNLEGMAITGVAVDPKHNVYYSTSRGETAHKLAYDEEQDEWTEAWTFDDHATDDDPDFDNDEECDVDGDCTDIESIAVTPGSYGAFPDTWKNILDEQDDD